MANAGTFKKGEVRPGQGKRGKAKTTLVLKEAILLAAEETGEDEKGKGGLTGYLRRVAREDVKAFAGLLGRVLPLQVTGEDGEPIKVARIELVAMTDDNRQG